MTMHLHDLVTLKQKLTRVLNTDSVVKSLFDLQNSISTIKTTVPVLSDEYKQYVDSLMTYYDTVIEQVQRPVNELEVQLKQINIQIDAITQKLFAGNYELEERYGTVDFVRNSRRIYINADVEQTVKQRILLHTNWRYPALEIGCRDGEWTQFLVASDPLYIMDRQREFIESTNDRFPEPYQNRLRKYPLVDHDLSALPVGQFNFIFSWGYFNYVSMDTMKQYIEQAYELLRPGGIFMFSYNNGDTPAGAGMAENFAQTYMPKSMLVPLCERFGYSVTEFDFEPNISWLEIKKPGTLETNKAHQVLGEIKHINL